VPEPMRPRGVGPYSRRKALPSNWDALDRMVVEAGQPLPASAPVATLLLGVSFAAIVRTSATTTNRTFALRVAPRHLPTATECRQVHRTPQRVQRKDMKARGSAMPTAMSEGIAWRRKPGAAGAHSRPPPAGDLV
jgi:hypothetical protein